MIGLKETTKKPQYKGRKKHKEHRSTIHRYEDHLSSGEGLKDLT